MNIYMTLGMESFDDNDMEDAVYYAAKDFFKKKADKYVSNIPAKAIDPIINTLSEKANMLFSKPDYLEIGVPFDKKTDVEEYCFDYLSKCIQKTLISCFEHEILYTKDKSSSTNIDADVTYCIECGDIMIYYDPTFALFFDCNRLGMEITDK